MAQIRVNGTAKSGTTNNAPTVATAIPDQVATVGTAFSYAFPADTFADADAGDTLSYTAVEDGETSLPSWLTFTAATRTFSGTPAASDIGTLSVKVTASDGTDSVSDTFDIKVPQTDVCIRTAAVRDAIVDRVSGVSDCADLTPAQLAAITGTLGVSSSSLTALKAGDFAGLTALAGLSLSDNSLDSLPPGVFDELTALTDLNLNLNSLTLLPAGVFDKLTALTKLRLRHNVLDSLPAGVFDELTSLTNLWLDTNRLTELPAGVFDELAALERLNLSDNSLASLPAGVFDELAALERLNLSDNSLASLPVDVFDALTALTTLSLQDNPGAPFAPTADAGTDQTVATSASVTLSGTVAGPWGDNATWNWLQVDGADSNALLGPTDDDFVILTGVLTATASFTAPATAKTLYFKLFVTPKPGVSSSHGIGGDVDWVTVQVGSADTTAPRVTSIEWQAPLDQWTNADELTWRVTFDENVANVGASDFAVSGTTATLTVAEVTASTVYDVTAAGGDLAGLDADVTLSFASGHDIEDISGNALTNTTPTGTNQAIYIVDNTAPTVSSIERRSPSSTPTNADTLTWRVRFNEPVDAASVSVTDFSVSGTTAPVSLNRQPGGRTWGVIVTGGDLAGLDGDVTLSFASGHGITDEAGNALTNTTPAGTNEATYTMDNTAPSFASATVNGTSLVITFDEDLAAAANLANGAFAVKKTPSGGTEQTVTLSGSPSISGAAVTLTLAGAVVSSDTVTVAYTRPDRDNRNRLEDAAGNEVATFTDRAVSNRDTTAPVLRSATVDGATLVLTYDEDLNGSSTPAPGDFTVTVAGRRVTVSGVAVSGRTVTLTLSSTVLFGQAVTLGYTAGANPIEDGSDNAAANLSGQAVENATGLVGLVFARASVEVDEGGTAEYTVALDAQPAATVTLAVTSGDAGAATVSPSSLTFTTSDWATAQTVTVTGVEDADQDDESVTLTHSAAGVATGRLAVAVRDDDRPNDPPALAAELPVRVVLAGRQFRYLVPADTFRDPDGDALTWSAAEEGQSGLPGWLGFDPETRIFTGTPQNDSGDANGRLRVVLTVADPDGETASHTFSFKVSRDLAAPALEWAHASGRTLTLGYGEALDAGSAPGTGAYAVTVGGSANAVQGVRVTGSSVVLTLASAVTGTPVVKVAYTVPGSDPVQDLQGNDAAAFSDRSATTSYTISVRALSSEVGEGAGAAAFAIELWPVPTDRRVAFGADWRTTFCRAEDCAQPGYDYNGEGGSVLLNWKHHRRIFRIPVVDDVFKEGNETFGVALSNPEANPAGAAVGGVSIGTAEAEVTIRDNDTLPAVTLRSPWGGLLGAKMCETCDHDFSVWLTGPGRGEVAATWRSRAMTDAELDAYEEAHGTRPARAAADADFTPQSGTLTFRSGETVATFTDLRILHDEVHPEPEEIFVIELTDVSSNAVLDPGTRKAFFRIVSSSQPEPFAPRMRGSVPERAMEPGLPLGGSESAWAGQRSSGSGRETGRARSNGEAAAGVCPVTVSVEFLDGDGAAVEVDSLAADDFTVANGRVGTPVADDDGLGWTVPAWPDADFSGLLRVRLPAGARWEAAEQAFTVAPGSGGCAAAARGELASLDVGGLALAPGFAGATTAYTAEAEAGAGQVTVTAAAVYGDAQVAVAPADADADAEGHQVALAEGETAVTVTVTPADGSAAQTYTVAVTRAAACPSGAPEDAFWQACLRPGGDSVSGFNRASSVVFSSYGSLSETAVETGGKTWAVAQVAAWEGNLTVGFSDGAHPVPDAWVLQVGDRTFRFADAAYNAQATEHPHDYVWSGAELDWSEPGAEVTLSLRAAPAPASNALAALELGGLELSPAFAAETVSYTANAPAATGEVTVTASALDGTASVAIAPADADADAEGHQVALAEGETAVTVTVTPSDGSAAKTYAVAVTRAAPAGALTRLTLIDAATQREVATLADGAAYELDAGGSYAFRTRYHGGRGIESVAMRLTGAKDASGTDDGGPYSLYGEAGGRFLGEALPAGSYTLTARAYSQDGGAGAVLGTLTVSFTVKAPAQAPAGALTRLTLIDAATQNEVATLADGAAYDLAPGGSYAFRTRYHGGQGIESVAMRLSGAKEASGTDDGGPYSLYGEESGRFLGEALPAGSYTLTATAYAGDGGAGAVLGTLAVSFRVLAPPALGVADARAEEGTDASLDFAVTLDRAPGAAVSVDYATSDGTAVAGEDYTETSGTLTFAAGETEKTVSVPVLDDAVDEGEETMRLTLSSPSGLTIADGEAVGTIANSDPLQRMWLARFGRTAASQVVDAVADRLASPLAGAQVTVGGQTLALSREDDEGLLADALTTVARALGAPAGAAPGMDEGPGGRPEMHGGARDRPGAALETRTVTGRELLLGSAFHLASGGDAGGPGFAAWGRVTTGGFDGREEAASGPVRVDGEVTTGIVGADAAWERWLAGVAVSVSEGEGTFDSPGADDRGTLESSLTGVHPYARVSLSERVRFWGLLGFGSGEMTMRQEPNEHRDYTVVSRTDIDMRLGAVGGRGALLEAGEGGGMDLALKADAFVVRMESAKAENTVATGADASRVRLALEGSRTFAMGEGATLTPGLELGLRHDGGDAETGTGVELGGRIAWADAGSGLSVEAGARTLIAHEDSGYGEWGASGAVRLDPGASGRGLSFTLAPTVGAASSGVERLWSLEDARGLAANDEFEAEGRLDAELGYGLPVFGAFTGTPYAGLGLSERGRDWRLGWRLGPGATALDFALGVEGTWTEPANDDAEPAHGVMLRGSLRW